MRRIAATTAHRYAQIVVDTLTHRGLRKEANCRLSCIVLKIAIAQFFFIHLFLTMHRTANTATGELRLDRHSQDSRVEVCIRGRSKLQISFS